MPYIHKIFEKATIRSVVDFLLFGLGPDEDTRDYEERLDELYNKFEEAVRKYDSNPTSELLDLSNELSSETASVYTEIGLQLGVLLVLDVVTNLRCEKDLKRCNMTMGNENENLISKFYKMQEATYLQETLMKDKEYQKAEHDIIESTKKAASEISFRHCLLFAIHGEICPHIGLVCYSVGFSIGIGFIFLMTKSTISISTIPTGRAIHAVFTKPATI